MAVIGTARGWTAVWVLAIALGSHALLPYFPFPRLSDQIFAPLAEAWADPALFPRDDQLRAIAPAPWAYSAVYWLAKPTLGLAPGFWAAAVLLTVAAVFAVHAVMRRMGAAGIALPIAVAVGLIVARPGVGSGAAGGLASGYFQHPWIGLVLVFWAFAAILGRRPALAGLALGAAVYAQPATALHGALAVAAACLATGRCGLRALGVAALAAGVIALPAAHAAIAVAVDAPVAADYLFAAPGHYRPDWPELLLGWGYLALGAASAALLRRERPAEAAMALGLLGGLGAFHLVATLFFAAMPSRWPPLYLIDATRSSPLFFALAAALFAAAAEHRCLRGLTADGWRSLIPLGLASAIALALMVANALATGWFFLLAGLLVVTTPDRAVPRVALAATLILVFAMVTPRIHLRPPAGAQRIGMFEWANRETPADALFVIPPGMHDFRLFARRSAYADFGLLTAAPRPSASARARLEQVAQPGPEALAMRGWPAMGHWDRAYAAAGCREIARLLAATGATHFVLPVRTTGAGRPAPDCGTGLPAVFQNPSFTVYRTP